MRNRIQVSSFGFRVLATVTASFSFRLSLHSSRGAGAVGGQGPTCPTPPHISSQPCPHPGSLDHRETHRSPLSPAVHHVTLASAVQPGRESWLLAYMGPRQFGSLPWWLRRQRVHLQCWRPGFNPWVRKIPGGGHGNHSSILAWRATVHGVAKSQTRLSDFHFHFLSLVGRSLQLRWDTQGEPSGQGQAPRSVSGRRSRAEQRRADIQALVPQTHRMWPGHFPRCLVGHRPGLTHSLLKGSVQSLG